MGEGRRGLRREAGVPGWMTDWMWREGTTLISWGSPFMKGRCVCGVGGQEFGCEQAQEQRSPLALERRNRIGANDDVIQDKTSLSSAGLSPQHCGCTGNSWRARCPQECSASLWGSLAKAELLPHFSGTSVGSVLGPGPQPWGDMAADPSPV